ncbi:MAG: RDD family protein [Mycoplasma sp.]
MEKKSKVNNSKARYKLAKASDRILARIIDLIVVFVINIGFGALIFLTDPSFKGTLEGFIVSEPYRYLLFGLISWGVFFLYFVILPYYWKGQTLGLKLFKLGIYNQLLLGFLFNIIKKEVFVWMIAITVGLLFSVVLFIVGSADNPDAAWKVLLSLLTFKKDSDGPYQWISVTFSSFYTLDALILLVVLINTIMRSEKTTLIDNWSNTVVVKLKDINSSKQNNNLNKIKTTKRKNYSLPGVILENPNEEIDSLN